MARYLQCSIYSEKISEKDYSRFFNNLISRKNPFLGLIRFSDILTTNGLNLVVKRYGKTIKILVENRKDLHLQSPLMFPFGMDKPQRFELTRSTLVPRGIYILPKGNLFDFMIKDDIIEVRVTINKFLGRFYAFGIVVDQKNNKRVLFLFNPTKFFEIDLELNPAFYIDLLDPKPKLINIKSSEPVFEQDDTSIGVDNFDVFQHSLFVGTSGAGKTKALEIMIKAILKNKKDANIVVIDPHNEFSSIFKQHKIVDFNNNYIEPLSTTKDKTPLQTQLISNTITATIGQENKYAERIVFYAVHLLTSIDELTLENLNLLLTDSTKRSEFASMCEN
ncbi:ATP-binding protein, partial [Candidatus Micrarchaeota archaeon]|nr:ATP-binding protein [Candidatus Micrarchaeota archaeon]